jgi:hypothetical protein
LVREETESKTALLKQTFGLSIISKPTDSRRVVILRKDLSVT